MLPDTDTEIDGIPLDGEEKSQAMWRQALDTETVQTNSDGGVGKGTKAKRKASGKRRKPKRALRPREIKFAKAMPLTGGNKTAAAIAAGVSPERAGNEGYRMAKRDEVRALYAERLEELNSAPIMSWDQRLAFLGLCAREAREAGEYAAARSLVSEMNKMQEGPRTISGVATTLDVEADGLRAQLAALPPKSTP